MAINRLWHVDWDRYESLAGEAKDATAAEDYAESVRIHSQLIRFFADQFRKTLQSEEQAGPPIA